jgi:hypothetical protein
MVRASMSISGEEPISCEQEGLVARFQRAVAADAGHGLAVGVEAQEEQRDAVPLVEVLEVQLALEAEVAVAPLRLVQVELPQVGPLMGVVALEPHTRCAVDEACAIAIPPTDHVPH